jgi:hypothetical protein
LVVRSTSATKAACGCRARSWFISATLLTSGMTMSTRIIRNTRSWHWVSASRAETQPFIVMWLGTAWRNFLWTFSMSSTIKMSTKFLPPALVGLGLGATATTSAIAALEPTGAFSFMRRALNTLAFSSSGLNGLSM